MKLIHRLMVSSLLAAGFMLAAPSAKADTIAINPDQAYQNGVVGSTVVFSATLTNTDRTTTIFLNAAEASLNAVSSSSSLPVDTDPFFINFPISIDPGLSTADAELFDVFLPDGTPLGLYAGTIAIFGGTDSGSFDLLGTETFNVEVTPEPGSALLLALGSLALGCGLRFGWIRSGLECNSRRNAGIFN